MHPTSSKINAGPLTLTVTEVGSTRGVAAEGELDLSNVTALARLLDELEQEGAEAIVLDLEALEFIDSTGLALLLRSHQRLNRDGGTRLRLVASRATAVRRVFAVTGLDESLPFVADGLGREWRRRLTRASASGRAASARRAAG